MSAPEHPLVLDWLRIAIADGPLPAEAVVQALVPLMRQVLQVHEQGLVAPLDGLGALRVAENQVYFAISDAQPIRSNAPAVARIEHSDARAVEILDRRINDTAGDAPVQGSRLILAEGDGVEIAHPVFVRGFSSWEQRIQHHDQATDCFCLGQILAALALGLDLSQDEELAAFVAARHNPFALHPHLHPVLGRLIVRMAEPRRSRRIQDLSACAALLASHRDQAASGWPLDLGLATASPQSRRQTIQARLRDRLFDCSRRNRLLYYRPTLAHANLTVASVPTQLAVDAIRADELCTWQGAFAEAVLSLKAVTLGRWLRIEDAPYLTGLLERIRADERRDVAEVGSSQLRLVVAFLRWHNLKEDRAERIASPLLLLPVVMERKKGVRDAWTLRAITSHAEVNPALRHQLRQLYGLDLPEAVDLGETTVVAFQERLQLAVQASEPGVTVRLVDRPRIDLVLQTARARAEIHRRKARMTGRGIRRVADVDYSYERDNFQPLGLRLFLRYVKPVPFHLGAVAGARSGPRRMPMVAPTAGAEAVRSQERYVLRDDGDANPYAWEVDCCTVTLGNFNYRKMSLVRDYHALLERDTAHPAFDGLFAEVARPSEDPVPAHDPTTLWPVVSSDPTQDAAVARARTGASFVIQGPPGTCKSQTITNLIADQVARGKRVLFVCSKRAALDVVHHRLQQCGLDRLCTLIHDTQEDKKPFIADLRAQYEDWLGRGDEREALRRERSRILAAIGTALAPLTRYDQAMLRSDPADQLTLHALLMRLLSLERSALADPGPAAPPPPAAPAAAADTPLPPYQAWRAHGAAVAALAEAIGRAGAGRSLAGTGLRHLAPQALRDLGGSQALAGRLDACRQALAAVLALGGTGALGAELAGLPCRAWAGLGAEAGRLQLLADRGLLALLDRNAPEHEELQTAMRTLADPLTATAAAARARTANWTERLPSADCVAVLDQARACEDAWLRWLNPTWWRLRRILMARYRFSAHVIAPRWSAVVMELMADDAAQAALTEARRRFTAAWKVDDLRLLAETVAQLHGAVPTPGVQALRRLVRGGQAGSDDLQRLISGAGAIDTALAAVDAVCGAAGLGLTAAAVGRDLAAIQADLPLLAHCLPPLRDLAAGPPVLWELLQRHEWQPRQLEVAILQGAIRRAEEQDPELGLLDGGVLDTAAVRLRGLATELLTANARLILGEAQAAFCEKARRSALPAAPDAAERDWRKRYSRGRRELEHEFGKVMRFRSIRDLADDGTGLVLADLKPVWLMSPLSVSDALPLERSGFDVVIYDEASQIPIEEAIPALYRAPQIIVVGDRQQLPPSDFFSSASGDQPGEPGSTDEPDAGVSVAIEHDSFLTQAASSLPGTMLGWHYRSRSEALIAFSNQAFYDGRLLTIPDVALPQGGQAIRITAPEEASAQVAAVLGRPISHHRLAASPYENRRNRGEAAYIAQLVRALLASGSGLSIGIVAFSEAQQGEIEGAVSALAQADPVFSERYESELQRQEDSQFCGLFIKNLENVQGDERDLIILSVCYGPDRSGRMLMNFGPINQSGGEKRLNVVFSRARRHMVVVSSIDAEHITNDFNDGANTLKRYLAYAAALSAGQTQAAARVLGSLCPEPTLDQVVIGNPIAQALGAALREHGFVVDQDVGGSRLRCDLAVRAPGENRYRLGIMIDAEAGYRQLSVWERELARPSSLAAFGWTIQRVCARDWSRDHQAILTAILHLLA